MALRILNLSLRRGRFVSCRVMAVPAVPVVPADRPFRSDTEMNKRPRKTYWIGFIIILALLAVAPLVLPEFWRRFLTEILIWGLLAMSSDILIGYTGMISFGHSAFFGLGDLRPGFRRRPDHRSSCRGPHRRA
jgi:hypothetical protein